MIFSDLNLFVYWHVFLNYPNCFLFCMYCDICTFVDCFYTFVCPNKSSTELMLYMFKHVRQKIKFLNLNLNASIGIQGLKLSNYVLEGLNFMFGIPNAQDSEYTG